MTSNWNAIFEKRGNYAALNWRSIRYEFSGQRRQKSATQDFKNRRKTLKYKPIAFLLLREQG